MKTLQRKTDDMGVFQVPLKLRNWQNRFLPPEQRGQDIECEAVVDSGAVELALPAEVIERLKLEHTGDIKVHTADGAKHLYRVFGIIDLEVQGRRCQVRAIELPRGARALLGAIPLEQMDWHISPKEQRLVGNPESPNEPVLPLY